MVHSLSLLPWGISLQGDHTHIYTGSPSTVHRPHVPLLPVNSPAYLLHIPCLIHLFLTSYTFPCFPAPFHTLYTFLLLPCTFLSYLLVSSTSLLLEFIAVPFLFCTLSLILLYPPHVLHHPVPFPEHSSSPSLFPFRPLNSQFLPLYTFQLPVSSSTYTSVFCLSVPLHSPPQVYWYCNQYMK